jgi:hypothetical protein
MRIWLLLPVFLLSHLHVFTQGETNNWHFGCKSGLTFIDGDAIPITSAIETREGVASISDPLGNVLFYTDGQIIYDDTDQITVTGLKGDGSSTSSSIIVPKAGSTSLFWIFTVDKVNGSNGVHYYEYDAATHTLVGNTNGVNIIPGFQNHTEKITAVKKCSGPGFWVCTIDRSGIIYVYDVTSTVTLSSTYSTGENLTPRNSTSYMKFSPDGRYLTVALPVDSPLSGTVDIYQFDNATGTIEFLMEEINFLNIGQPYGIEFSRSTNFLYVSVILGSSFPNAGKLYQYDMNAPDISGSGVLLGEDSSFPYARFGALQLGPNGKIYLSMELENDPTSSVGCFGSSSYLGVIDQPEMEGTDAGFTQEGLYLGPGDNTQGVKIGLPTIVASFLQANVTTTAACAGEANGSASVIPSSFCNGPYAFQWSTGVEQSDIPEGFSATLEELTAGDYSVTVQDGSGEEEVFFFSIEETNDEALCCSFFVNETYSPPCTPDMPYKISFQLRNNFIYEVTGIVIQAPNEPLSYLEYYPLFDAPVPPGELSPVLELELDPNSPILGPEGYCFLVTTLSYDGLGCIFEHCAPLELKNPCLLIEGQASCLADQVEFNFTVTNYSIETASTLQLLSSNPDIQFNPSSYTINLEPGESFTTMTMIEDLLGNPAPGGMNIEFEVQLENEEDDCCLLSDQTLTIPVCLQGAIPNPWKVFPNPAVEQIFIELPVDGAFLVDITDPRGNVVRSRNIKGKQGQFLSFELDGLLPGIYFLRFTDSNAQNHYQRIVISPRS